VRSFLFPTFTILNCVRALSRDIWTLLPDYYKYQFRIEPGLNYYARHYSRGVRYIPAFGLRHSIKEEKYGWRDGTKRRWAMIWDFAVAVWRLQTEPIRRALTE